MRILVLNSGSSSLKFKLFKMQDESVLCSGLIENIAEDISHISLNLKEHSLHKKMFIPHHVEALNVLFDLIIESGLIVTLDELYGVGHRVVHGGSYFSKAIVIDESAVKRLEELIPLAPLHNPANIAGIRGVSEKCSTIRQVAVFDTAFHQTMPPYAYRYALPKALYEDDNIRRFGFHGTSHAYVLKEASKLLDKETEKTNIISVHLGNGASVCAIQEGKSIDTSMGMTPLEGLVMGSRSGDLDPGIIFYLHRHKGYSIERIDRLLNKESGLLGLCGEKDMRLILERAKEDSDSQLALDIFVYRIKKYIGSYMAVLDNVDAIVFTGGIGENSWYIRQMVVEGLKGLGVLINHQENKKENKTEFSFHEDQSRVKLLVVETDEELEIALQAKSILISSSL